ncbi:hypothetical protein LIER_43635 [Lithospermum erythrorhizon]|uniref:Dof zinc finger protein n=1 Tax=Lithospermum erythrorhizon TaxID=34254 RepID=A0AAV3QHP0_LITER
MDSAQWPQGMVMKPMEEIIPTTDYSPKLCNNNPLEGKVRPQKEQALNCPRCNSTNTKFCYYNNYNLSQPRYFCKACRRYWTEGGTLRNIPVGGGSRKNKRSSTSVVSSANSNPSTKKINNPQDLSILPPPIIYQNPTKIHEGQDLNLGFTSEHDFKTFTELIQAPSFDNDNHGHSNNKDKFPTSTQSSHQLSPMELLTGITPSSKGFNSFIPIIPPQVTDSNNLYSTSGFTMPVELKPSLDFSLYGLGNNNNSGFGGTLQNVHQDQGNSRFLFPFEDLNLKQASTNSTATTDQHVQRNTKQQNNNTNNGNSTDYWNGVLGGRGTW